MRRLRALTEIDRSKADILLCKDVSKYGRRRNTALPASFGIHLVRGPEEEAMLAGIFEASRSLALLTWEGEGQKRLARSMGEAEGESRVYQELSAAHTEEAQKRKGNKLALKSGA